jgi:hypothetical protein
MGYSHYMRRNDIPRISAASFAECVVSWDFGRAHFPGAVVRLASGQFHHMLIRLLLIVGASVDSPLGSLAGSLSDFPVISSASSLVDAWAGPRILMLSHQWVPWICRCIVRCLICCLGHGFSNGVLPGSPFCATLVPILCETRAFVGLSVCFPIGLQPAH